MNRGAAGCEHPRQDSRGYRRFDNQVTSSSRLSHRVSHVPSDSKRHLTNNGASYSARAKRRSLVWEQGIDYLIRPDLFRELKIYLIVGANTITEKSTVNTLLTLKNTRQVLTSH